MQQTMKAVVMIIKNSNTSKFLLTLIFKETAFSN